MDLMLLAKASGEDGLARSSTCACRPTARATWKETDRISARAGSRFARGSRFAPASVAGGSAGDSGAARRSLERRLTVMTSRPVQSREAGVDDQSGDDKTLLAAVR